MARSRVKPSAGPQSSDSPGSSSVPENRPETGPTGCACGGDIDICISVGPEPAPGVVIAVGIPFGAETPARPPRIPPAPGKLPNEPPPPPGNGPSSEPDVPGSAGTLVSTVGPCAP